MIKVTKLSKKRERIFNIIIESGATNFSYQRCYKQRLVYDNSLYNISFSIHPESSYEPVEWISTLIYGNDLKVYDKTLGDFIYG